MADLSLPFTLDKRVRIRADRDTVFRFFTDSARWAAWWGPGSTIDPRVGGRIYVRYANGVEASGAVVSIDPPKQIVFTFGYESGEPIAPGASRVTIDLAPAGDYTDLKLRHHVPSQAARNAHDQGWRYQLSMFANAVADFNYASVGSMVADWYRAWAETDETARAEIFGRIAIPEVEFRDRYSALSSRDDLIAQAGASHRFMPGIRLEQRGGVRHCQGMVLSDWAMTRDGADVATGTNFFVFSPSGAIEWVTGFAG